MQKSNNVMPKVLVVEDSKVTISVLSTYLENMGITQIFKAESGEQAMALYRKERPDIILLDIQLPDIDGFSIAQQVRKLEQKDDWTAIIFLTGMSKDEDLARGIAVGGDDYLTKPVSSVVLEAKVRAMQRLLKMQRELVKVTRELNVANAELQRLSTTDALTGIANRRALNDFMSREWRRCLRIKKQMSLVMLDIDFFKLYNDKYGHQAGDDCLRSVAEQILRAAPRGTDMAARYGGEEFMLVLSETNVDGAVWIAERVRQMVSDLRIPHYATPSKLVSVSCGVVTILPESGRTLEVFLKSVDAALYQAKRGGRDQVVCGEYGKT